MANTGVTNLAGRDVQGMVAHWMRCPAHSRLGLTYGNDLPAIIQSPMSAGLADGQIAKLVVDVPLLQALPAGAVNIYARDTGMDEKEIVIGVVGEIVDSGFGATGGGFSPDRGEEPMVLQGEVDPIDTVGMAYANRLHFHVNDTMPTEGFW